MRVAAVRTPKIKAGQAKLNVLLDEVLPSIANGTVLVITSKLVSLCEGSVVPMASTNKEDLIRRESDYYLPATLSKYGHHFTIINNSLAAVAGIDESNGDGNYILWPKDAQRTANQVRRYLSKKHKLKRFGVIISDSTCLPMRWGTIGIPLAYSGFEATKNYIGTPDLFGKLFKVSRGGVALGLAAAAVVVMGEGTEQTPLAIINDIDFVNFQNNDPTPDELENFYISNFQEDLFAPFLSAVEWQKGGHG